MGLCRIGNGAATLVRVGTTAFIVAFVATLVRVGVATVWIRVATVAAIRNYATLITGNSCLEGRVNSIRALGACLKCPLKVTAVHTSCVCLNGLHSILCGLCLIGVHYRACVKVIVIGSAILCSYVRGNLVGLVSYCIYVKFNLILAVIHNLGGVNENITKGLDNTACLAGEGALAIRHICTLHGDEHRILCIKEIVCLRENACTHSRTNTVLSNSVIEVVIYMNRCGSYSGMTRVGVVKPIMVIGEVVLLCLTAVAEQTALSCVPKMVVGVSNISGLLGIKSAIALILVSIRACHTVEDVTVVNPNVIVILLKANAVALITVTVHKRDVSNLKIGNTLDSDTKSVKYCILTDTLDGHSAGELALTKINKQVTLVKSSGVGDVTDKSDTDRILLISLLKGGKNILYTNKRLGAIFAYGKIHSNGVFILISNVNDSGITLKSAVLIVRTAGCTVYKGKAASIMRGNLKIGGYKSLGIVLCSINNRNNLHIIVACLKADCICAPIVCVFSDKHIVNALPCAGFCRSNVNVVAVCARYRCPLNVCTLQPTTLFGDNTLCSKGANRHYRKQRYKHADREDNANNSTLSHCHKNLRFCVFLT